MVLIRLCEGLKKKNVRGKKNESLETALREWDLLSILDNPDLHFMNEATGIGRKRSSSVSLLL